MKELRSYRIKPARYYKSQKNQIIYSRLAADLDTPVSLLLKLTKAAADSFVLESVTGGEVRGRFSIIGMDPDLIWRCKNGKSEIFNCGYGKGYSVKDVLDAFNKISKKKIDIEYGPRRKGDVISAFADTSKAKKVFDDPITTEVKKLDKFYKAEVYHQDYFENNPNAPYCTFVIAPKLNKLKKKGTIWDQ